MTQAFGWLAGTGVLLYGAGHGLAACIRAAVRKDQVDQLRRITKIRPTQ